MFLRFSARYSLVNVPGVRTPWLTASPLALTHRPLTRSSLVGSAQHSTPNPRSHLLTAPMETRGLEPLASCLQSRRSPG